MLDYKRFMVLFVIIIISLNIASAAENTFESVNKQNSGLAQCDDPDSVDTFSYNMKSMILTNSYSQSQAGETILVTSGDNLDKYLFWPNTIEPSVTVQTNDSEIYSAELTLSTYDVDENCGNACGGVCEVDTVYFNGHYLGTLTGANNQWSTTTFLLDPSWVNGEVGGSPGINYVVINIDTASKYCWAVEVDWVQLIINAGVQGNAKIVSLSTDKQAYSPSDTINTAVDLTTSANSQSVRLEINLYDPQGVNIDGSSTTHSLIKNTITSVNRQLSIPVNSPSGDYTVEAIVYDSASVQQDKKTLIVSVGDKPDFYITRQDIEFSQIKDIPTGLEVTVDTLIHYENAGTPQDVNIKFYDEDLNTGKKTEINSKTVSMSPGINTVSIEWTPSSSQHRIFVVLDPDDKIEETNEDNNEASKYLEEPIIDDVKSTYKGFFLSGLDIDNTYYVFSNSENVDYVEFNMNGIGKTDSDGSDGWSMTYNMGSLPLSSKLTTTAFTAVGIPSEPYVITPEITESPVWFEAMNSMGSPNLDISAPKKFNNIWQIWYSIRIPDPPIVAMKDVPVPFLGGKFGVNLASKFGYKIRSDDVLKLFGGGEGEVKVANKGGIFEVLYQGLLKREGTPPKLKQSGEVRSDAKFILPTGIIFDLGLIKVEVQLVPEVKCIFPVLESSSGGIIPGLDWGNAKGTLFVALEGFSKIHEGIGYTEGHIGGKPGLKFKVPQPYYDGVIFQFYGKVKQALFGWSQELEYKWEWCDPSCSSSFSSQKMITSSQENIEWKPMARDYITNDYARFSGSKSNLKMSCLNTLSINALGAQESSIIENIFPYASPSIASDNNGNAIMVWTHDDINKPQVQGFEILYSEWDGNSWSSPDSITDNYLPEFQPSVMFDSNGNAVALWTLFNNASITASSSVLSVLDDVELAYSVWDKNTKTWSTPEILTDNSMFDGLVSLSNDINGDVTATWIADKDNDITTISDRDIYYSTWNGSDWSVPKVVINDVAVDTNPVFVYSLNNAISVWSQDTDGNIATKTDRELYYTIWNGNEWSTPTYLTNDNMEDTAPSISFDKFNKITLTWIKRNESSDKVYISTYESGWSSTELVAEGPTIYEMRLSFDSNNNAVVVWQGASPSGQNIFYTVHDNTNQLWSGEKQLTNDLSTEWQLSTAINSMDELMISYVKTNLFIVNDAVEEGATNLSYLIHPIMLDITLSSSDIVFSNSIANPGDTISINAKVHNIGDLQANLVEVTFFDGISGPQIGTTQTISSLPAGQNASVSVTWAIPNLQQSHDIYVKIDPDDKLPESNESNNEAFASIVLPDLEINESDVIFSYEQGSLNINATIHNSGVLQASNVPVEIFDEGISGALINATTIASLNSNSNETISITWNTQGVSSGIHNISIILDRIDGIRELNETNNIANITVMLLPDLTLNSNDISFSETSEGDITIDANVRNIGLTNAENIRIEFFDGDPFTNGVLIGNATIDSIPANSEFSTEIDWLATSGQHDIYVKIDPHYLIPELDKSNNLALNHVIITPAADLIPLDIIFSDVDENGQVSISALIHNAGSADVPYTTVGLYNGTPIKSTTNPYVTHIPNLLGTEVVPFVSSNGDIIVNLIADWTPEENLIYNICLIVDPKDNVHEINELNNIVFKEFELSIHPTELNYIGDISANYSDLVTLEAQLNDSRNGNPLLGKSIKFILGAQTAIATTGPDGIASITIKLDQPDGTYNVQADFAGDDDYSPASDTKSFSITKEEVEISYTGDTIVPSTSGSINLRATLKEVDDDYGDLEDKLKVNFMIYSASDLSNPIATVESISVKSAGMGVGTATATIDNIQIGDYLIKARIAPNDYYNEISSPFVPLIVYEPTGQFATGGGWIWDPTGSHGNFGFTVKYNKKGKVQGNSIYVYRLNGLDYIVKSNVWIGMAMKDSNSVFQGKAALQIYNPVTDELQPESSGNYQFTVEAFDNELSNNPDTYKITVLDKNGLVYHTAMGELQGGNIVIHDKDK